MAEWFECKLTYDKEEENGSLKKTSESYLVDAMSFTEAEAVVISEASKFITTSFNVAAVKKEKIFEMFKNEEDGGIWFKAKLAFITVDEVSGKEKRKNFSVYIQSKDMFTVASDIKKNMEGTMADYEIGSITATKIEDVFEHQD